MTLFSAAAVDDAARHTIRTALDRNLFVKAGAGTGKTSVLVARVVNLFATGTLTEPGQLVAITFTEAAAAELRDRIRAALDAAAADPDLGPDEQARCGAARRRVDEAVVTTLHGFAQRILAEHPVEAGLPPRFEVDDGTLARVRFRERWVAFLDDLYDDPAVADDLRRAHALGLTTNHLREVALALHDRWDRVVGVELAPRGSRPPTDAIALLAPAVEALTVAGERIELVDPLAKFLRHPWREHLARVGLALEEGDEIEVLRALAQVTDKSAGGKSSADVWGPDKKRIVALLNGARDAVRDHLSAQRTAVIERLLPHLQAFTAAGVEARRQEGRLEFHDLLVRARDLLLTRAEVRHALAARYRVILIDEFQDTDPLQVDIAFLLAARDPAAEPAPWREAELAPGKVVIVGDPKQSIYGFRGADIAVWDQARACFGADRVRLEQNFRTVPRIIEWVNGVFGSVIGDGKPGGQPPYEALDAARPEIAEDTPVILVGEPRKLPIDDLRTAEADDIARLIALLRRDSVMVHDAEAPRAARPLRYDDVAILLPTRSSLSHLERALDAEGVPYRVESRSLVWSTDIVRQLMAVLGAIDDPGDEVALVAALRSPGFACSDVELLEWRAAGGRWRYHADPPEGLPATHAVAAAMRELRRYHELRSAVPVDVLVEQVIRERRLIELTFTQRRPRDHWRRLRFVLDQSRAFVEAGGRSLAELVAWADLQAEEGATVVETPARELDDDAVRILTIHGSKGLEFPVVVLAGLGTQLQHPSARVAWAEDRPEVSVGRKEGRFQTWGWDTASLGAREASVDEGHRLLYVAATRARDLLVLGMYHKEGDYRSHASTLWPLANDAGGRYGHLARRVPLPPQLTLPIDDHGPPPSPDPLAQRDAFVAAYNALAEATQERRVLSATAVAQRAAAQLDDVDDLDGLDDLEEPPSEAAWSVDPADGAPTPVPRAGRAEGTARGRAVHAVLEAVDLAAPGDLRALAAHHAAAEGIGDAADEVAALARSLLDSPAVAAAGRAPRSWREVYVAAPLDGGRLLEGYVDLLYEDGDGVLVLVDHKTDAATTDAAVDAAAERYRLQLGAYALAIEAAVGRPVGRAVLVFARADGPAVEREVRDLADAVRAARAWAAA